MLSLMLAAMLGVIPEFPNGPTIAANFASVVTVWSTLSPVVARCDRGAPQPLGFHARGFGHLAEVFPPKSRQNSGSRPVAYFYDVGYPGTEWRVDARRVWTAELVNLQMPQAALVSMAGDFVTLDDYHQAGMEHALVIYGKAAS